MCPKASNWPKRFTFFFCLTDVSKREKKVQLPETMVTAQNFPKQMFK